MNVGFGGYVERQAMVLALPSYHKESRVLAFPFPHRSSRGSARPVRFDTLGSLCVESGKEEIRRLPFQRR